MEEELQFGTFSIIPARCSLMREGTIVPLGSRASDILLFLLNHPAELKYLVDLGYRLRLGTHDGQVFGGDEPT